MNCNACGSSNLIEGTVVDNHGRATGAFVPNDTPFFKKMFGGGSKIHSYACLHCNNLQFTVDFGEKEKAQYVEFEGRQPGLLERINEESDTQD